MLMSEGELHLQKSYDKKVGEKLQMDVAEAALQLTLLLLF